MPLVALALHRLVARPSWRAALALGAAGAFQAATSIYYGVIGAVGAAVSLVVAGRGDRRATDGLGGAPRRRRGDRRRRAGGAVRVAVPSRCSGARASRATCSKRRATPRRRRATSARRTPTSSTAAPAGCAPIAAPSTSCSRASSSWPSRIYGLVVARRRGSGPLAAAAVATLVAGAVLSLGPDGLRALYATLHAWVFGFQAIRAPARFGVLVAFALATLAAIGDARAHRRGRARAWWGVGLPRAARDRVPARPAGVDAGAAAGHRGHCVAARRARSRRGACTCRWAATSRTRR